ncbi:MBL fold metallo-hydrolase [Oxalicibacterium flavum]|uniref:MBL fold metallo-hydrolase n=1 Tax=Oxalicibacterium flavum TaxID=179467 RepID=A0A8J2UL91_9BURK|nr:MBL fold metallo-hydrolase [Oxalicibacterium flavum]GGC11673.1 MBL fold metallo-hydrolase [Oxalicibacterium flavum]
MSCQVQSFFDPATATVSHVIHAGAGTACAIVDPVLDYDSRSGRTATRSADRIAAFVEALGLHVQWLLETHAHADHVSAAPYLRSRFGGRIGIGACIRDVQQLFCHVYNFSKVPYGIARDFDHLFEPDEVFAIGELQACAWHVPGHTPADTAYLVGDRVFVGDTLFMPDVGTARCDFPGGDAAALYRSIRRLLALPAQTQFYLCHDYPPDSRAPAWTSTVAEQRACNLHVRDGIAEREFVAMRRARDATLALPELMLPAVQLNIRAGLLPPPEDNGVRYLKIPLDLL